MHWVRSDACVLVLGLVRSVRFIGFVRVIDSWLRTGGLLVGFIRAVGLGIRPLIRAVWIVHGEIRCRYNYRVIEERLSLGGGVISPSRSVLHWHWRVRISWSVSGATTYAGQYDAHLMQPRRYL